MKEALPRLSRAGALLNAATPSLLHAMEARGRASKVKAQSINVRVLNELDGAVLLAKTQTEALILVEDGLFLANAKRLAQFAATHRLPTIGFREYCESGGLRRAP